MERWQQQRVAATSHAFRTMFLRYSIGARPRDIYPQFVRIANEQRWPVREDTAREPVFVEFVQTFGPVADEMDDKELFEQIKGAFLTH